MTYLASVIGSLALMAIPPFAGFFSKESIIEMVGMQTSSAAHYAYWCLIIGAGVTAAYSIRALLLTFHGKRNYSGRVSETGWSIGLSLVVLSVPSIVVGLLHVVAYAFWAMARRGAC